ncbi:MAG: F-type H+-transporting ATPase subunit a [Salibacteraceae bacterium]|jgi:F-type H+-transporting ATPase subunit a
MEVVILQRFLDTNYCLFVMQNKLVGNLLLALMFVFSMNATANSHSEASDTDVKTDIKENITHHLMDSYEFTITHGVSMPLPIILIDNGVHVFMSSEFHHGESVVEKGGSFYAIGHGKIYKTDAAGTFHHAEPNSKGVSYISNDKPLDLSITKNVFMIMLMSVFMFFLFKGVSKSYGNGQMPSGAGRFLEPLVIYVRDEIARPNIGEKHYKKYMSYLLTVFFFIWFLNLAGMTPFGINVTGNIAITFALALMTFVITNVTANKNYWGHIFWMPGVPKPMRIVLAPIELLGVLIKPFALMIRLYANMSAGHIVLMSLVGLIFIFKSWLAAGPVLGLTLALSVLELLVAALQAYIFTMLTALYFGMAVEEHGDH